MEIKASLFTCVLGNLRTFILNAVKTLFQEEMKYFYSSHLLSASFSSKKKDTTSGNWRSEIWWRLDNPWFQNSIPANFGRKRKIQYIINILTSNMTKQVKVRDKKGIILFSDLGTFILNNRIADPPFIWTIYASKIRFSC